MRAKFFIPFLILVGGISFFYFFEMNKLIEKGMEMSGERIFRAKTEVEGVKLNFFKGRMRIGNISVADRDNPWQNLFEIGDITLEILPQALLLKKFVINKAQIKDVSWNTERKTYGGIEKKKKEQSKEEKKSRENKAEEKEKEKKKSKKAAVSIKDVLEEKKDLLKTPKVSEKIRKEIDDLDKKWKEKIKESDEKISLAKNAAKELKKIDAKKLKTTKEVLIALKTVQENTKILKETADFFKDLNKEYKTDKKKTKVLLDEFKKARENDWQLVSGFTQKPSESISSITQEIFYKILDEKMGGFSKYIKKILKVMERVNKQQKEKVPPKPKRKIYRGRDIYFASMKYPSFLLKEAKISVDKEQRRIEGTIKNIQFSSPRTPTVFDITGVVSGRSFQTNAVFNFPAGDFNFLFTLHNVPFEIQEEIPYLKISKMKGLSDIKIEIPAKSKMNFELRLHDIKTQSEKDFLTDVFVKTLKDVGLVLVKGEIPLTEGRSSFSSNLDEIFSRTARKVFEEKRKEAVKKAKKEFARYFEKYSISTKAIDKYEDSIKSRAGQVDKFMQDSDKLKKEIEERKEGIEKKSLDKLKDRFKKFRR